MLYETNLFHHYFSIIIYCTECTNIFTYYKNSNAHNDYFLKGKPESLYHRTFELSKDSLTGEIIIGKEFDSLSDSSFRIYFTNDGDVQEFHHIYNGTSSTSLRYFYDPEKRYCVLQTYLNSPESYQRNWIENYQSSDNTQSNVYNLIQEEYYMSDFGDSLLLTNRDTILCIEKDGIFYLISFITQIVNVIIILQKTVSIMHNT